MPALADPTTQPQHVIVPPDGGKWRDLGVRVASAAVLLPVALGCLWAGGWYWTALVLVGAAGMALEWRGLCRHRPAPLQPLLGAVYILPAVIALLWLRDDPAGGAVRVLFILCVVWSSDIGAYMTGRLFGGAKLAPTISPGKTWSGAAGGLVSAIVVGMIFARLNDGAAGSAMAIAALLGGVAQAGDLFESGLKRYFDVKDSGRSIPGHGGLLDRLDAVLTAAPVAAALLLLRGVELWR